MNTWIKQRLLLLLCAAKKRMINCLIPWPTNRSCLVDILSVLFGIGSWISVTGFWVELPVLIAHLPEGWRVSSQLSVAIQLANIGPLIYAVVNWLKKGHNLNQNDIERGFTLKTRSYIIYSLLILGITSNILLAFEWNATVTVSGDLHSIPLIVLMFSVGLIGCTSPVLFMPFMGIFPPEYLFSYLVGEGLGGFVPSMIALIQGFEDNSNSTSINTNATLPDNEKSSMPLFNPTVYFIIIASLMMISTISFFLLNNLNGTKRVKVDSNNTFDTKLDDSPKLSYNNSDAFNEIPTVIETATSAELVGRRIICSSDQEDERNNALSDKKNQSKFRCTSCKSELFHVLILQGWICFFSSGFLPGVSTFATLPYGNQVYHLSATLGAAIVPIGCSFAFILKKPPRIAYLGALNILASLLSVYTLVIASFSPEPPLMNTVIGKTIILINMVLYAGLSAFIKITSARICRGFEMSLFKENDIKEGSGRGPLFWCGAVSQGAAAFGSILDLTLVTILKLFKSK